MQDTNYATGVKVIDSNRILILEACTLLVGVFGVHGAAFCRRKTARTSLDGWRYPAQDSDALRRRGFQLPAIAGGERRKYQIFGFRSVAGRGIWYFS